MGAYCRFCGEWKDECKDFACEECFKISKVVGQMIGDKYDVKTLELENRKTILNLQAKVLKLEERLERLEKD